MEVNHTDTSSLVRLPCSRALVLLALAPWAARQKNKIFYCFNAQEAKASTGYCTLVVHVMTMKSIHTDVNKSFSPYLPTSVACTINVL